MVPRQPVLVQLDQSIQKCRLPHQPRRRHPSSRGSTETSTPKRPACVTLIPDKTKIEILAEDSDVLSEKLPKLKSKPKQNKTRINTNTKIVNSEPSQLTTQNDYDAAHTLNKLIQEKPVENDSLSTCDKNKSKNKKLENNQSKSTASDNTVPQLVKKKSKNKILKKRKEKTSCKQTSTVDTSTSTVNDENVTVAHDSSHRISPTDYDTREIEIIPAAPIRIGDPRFYVKVDILGEKFDMLFDHGAVSSWFGEKPAKLLEKYIKPSSTYLEGPTGDLCQNEGKVDINITIDDITLNTTFRVNKALQYEVLLGIDLQKKFNITICAGEEKWHTPANIVHYFKPNDKEVTCSLEAVGAINGLKTPTEIEKSIIKNLVEEKIPPTPKTCKAAKITPHTIDVQGHAPIRQHPRRITKKLLKAAHDEVDRLIREDIVMESNSPWCSCPVIVPKKDGKIRFCIDFRKINQITKKDAYPMHHMDSILDNLRNAEYLSKIDLSQAYHQIPLDPNSREITAFALPGKGLFHYKRLPYGLCNAPASFQRAMDNIFGPEWQPHVFIYIDDIIIATPTFNEHKYWLNKVIDKLNSVDLTINKEKSEFCCQSVQFLGYIIDREGLRTDPDKVKAVLNCPPPKNIKQLKSFMGMVGWYSRFLKDLAEIRTPLTKLTQKDIAWHWGPEQEQAFTTLKRMLTEAPVLARPDPDIMFTLQTDASNFALGAVLTQDIDGEEHPIAYASRALTKQERNYTVTEKECLAVLWAVEKYRGYILGSHFRVITDHASLKWLHNLKDPTGRLARWATALQAYSMEIIHRKGALHKVPDYLSRSIEEIASIDDKTAADWDEWYMTRIHEVAKDPDKFPDYRIHDNSLYINRPSQTTDPLNPDVNNWKLVIPQSLREKVLFEAHDTPHAGHLGREKTFERVAISYYWPKMRTDTYKYVRKCLKCQLHKVSQQLPAGLMGKRELEGPWIHVASDVMGPFPRSKNGNCYIVVFGDLFTRYIEIRALRKANAATILKKSIVVESNAQPPDAEVKITQCKTKPTAARVRRGRQQATQTQAAEATGSSSAPNDSGVASTQPTDKRDTRQLETTKNKMPRQPVLGQLDQSIQKCRLPHQPRRRHPSSRGSTETSTPKRPACVTLMAQELPRFRVKHIQTLLDVVFYRCHHGLRVEPTEALTRIRREFQDRCETSLLLQIHFGCTIKSSDYNIVLDYDRFAKTFADNFYRQKNYYLRKAGHMHGADKLARFPKVCYAHSYMQHDKILKRHQARANEVFVLALTRGTSFHGKCTDTIQRIQQLQAWFSKARDSCDFRFEIVANFHSLKATKIEALQAKEWKSANVPLNRSRIPDERSAITEVMEKITCFIEGTRNRYDAQLLQPIKKCVTDQHVRYDDLTTSLLDKSFFNAREASFNYLGGHACLYMRLLYETAADGDDMLTLGVDYVVDKLFRLVAFWRRFRIGQVCIDTEKLDMATYYHRVKSDDASISLYCSVNDVINTLLEPSDPMLACLLSSLNTSVKPTTLRNKLRKFVRERVQRWPHALAASSEDWSRWAAVQVDIGQFNGFHCFVTPDLQRQLQRVLVRHAKTKKDASTDTELDASVLRTEAIRIVSQEAIIDQIIADVCQENEREKRQEQGLQPTVVCSCENGMKQTIGRACSSIDALCRPQRPPSPAYHLLTLDGRVIRDEQKLASAHRQMRQLEDLQLQLIARKALLVEHTDGVERRLAEARQAIEADRLRKEMEARAAHEQRERERMARETEMKQRQAAEAAAEQQRHRQAQRQATLLDYLAPRVHPKQRVVPEKAVLTSSCTTSRSNLLIMARAARITVILDTGAYVSNTKPADICGPSAARAAGRRQALQQISSTIMFIIHVFDFRRLKLQTLDDGFEKASDVSAKSSGKKNLSAPLAKNAHNLKFYTV
ncbi:unnamed protein product [Trichogramma brassicae]|uniref:RNA-directed DNA polymerase n=1 Tax=Trichogramma brassicae TaxID=86971 RepID=A0A6H5I017_9HYME|nr:unnamed protein product [Trichogramma brassicae]